MLRRTRECRGGHGWPRAAPWPPSYPLNRLTISSAGFFRVIIEFGPSTVPSVKRGLNPALDALLDERVAASIEKVDGSN